ncbi:hypothetical protein ACI3EY_16600 [Ornithinimicrobium sp. LYQ92]|uniref:phage tail tube protein n=1 Tax=Serinicoccus sp. LYQ92 TaxID=3378798 RepID=UPI0038522561
MSARLADSDITTLWVVPGGIADINAGPTVTELESALNITCAVVEGYELGMTASDARDSARSVCDQGNVTEFGAANYAGNLTFLREGDVEAVENDSAYLRAAGFFDDRNKRFDLVRRGAVPDSVESIKSHDEDAVEGDMVEVYGFVTDYPQYRSGQNANSDATFTVPLGQQSRFNTRVAVQAAGV